MGGRNKNLRLALAKLGRPYHKKQKQKTPKRVGDIVQVGEVLPSILSSNK
jgi:hypothetical protein